MTEESKVFRGHIRSIELAILLVVCGVFIAKNIISDVPIQNSFLNNAFLLFMLVFWAVRVFFIDRSFTVIVGGDGICQQHKGASAKSFTYKSDDIDTVFVVKTLFFFQALVTANDGSSHVIDLSYLKTRSDRGVKDVMQYALIREIHRYFPVQVVSMKEFYERQTANVKQLYPLDYFATTISVLAFLFLIFTIILAGFASSWTALGTNFSIYTGIVIGLLIAIGVYMLLKRFDTPSSTILFISVLYLVIGSFAGVSLSKIALVTVGTEHKVEYKLVSQTPMQLWLPADNRYPSIEFRPVGLGHKLHRVNETMMIPLKGGLFGAYVVDDSQFSLQRYLSEEPN